jgi:hypothetical protein
MHPLNHRSIWIAGTSVDVSGASTEEVQSRGKTDRCDGLFDSLNRKLDHCDWSMGFYDWLSNRDACRLSDSKTQF